MTDYDRKTVVAERHPAVLAEARRIASQPVEDRLNGKQGERAQELMAQLLEVAGLSYGEALKLVSAAQWHSWGAGWDKGRESRRKV